MLTTANIKTTWGLFSSDLPSKNPKNNKYQNYDTLQFQEKNPSTILQQETRGVLKRAIKATAYCTIWTVVTALVFGKQLKAWACTFIDFIYQTMKQADWKKN